MLPLVENTCTNSLSDKLKPNCVTVQRVTIVIINIIILFNIGLENCQTDVIIVIIIIILFFKEKLTNATYDKYIE